MSSIKIINLILNRATPTHMYVAIAKKNLIPLIDDDNLHLPF